MNQENTSKRRNSLIFIAIAAFLMIGAGITFVGGGNNVTKLFSQFSGANTSHITAVSQWQPTLNNSYRTAVGVANATRLDEVVRGILTRGMVLNVEQFKVFLTNVDFGIKTLATQPEYISNQNVQNIVGYLTFELADAKTNTTTLVTPIVSEVSSTGISQSSAYQHLDIGLSMTGSTSYTKENVKDVVSCMLQNTTKLQAVDDTPINDKIAMTLNFWTDKFGVDDNKIALGVNEGIRDYSQTSTISYTPTQIRALLNRVRADNERTHDYYSDIASDCGVVVANQPLGSRSTNPPPTIADAINVLRANSNISVLSTPGSKISSYPDIYYMGTGTYIYPNPNPTPYTQYLSEIAPLYVLKLSERGGKEAGMNLCNELNKTKVGGFTDWELINYNNLSRLFSSSLLSVPPASARGIEVHTATLLLGNEAASSRNDLVAYESWFPLKDFPLNQAWVNNNPVGSDNGSLHYRNGSSSILLDDASVARQQSILLCTSKGKTDNIYTKYMPPVAPLNCNMGRDKVVEEYICGDNLWTNVDDKGWCKNMVWTDTMPVKTTAYFGSFQWQNGYYYGSFDSEQNVSTMVSSGYCNIIKARPRSGPTQSLCVASPCVGSYSSSTTSMTCGNGAFGKNGCDENGIPK